MKPLILLTSITLFVAFPVFAQPSAQSSDTRHITVEADEWVSLAPDFVRFTVIVEENGDSAAKAMQAANYKAHQIKTSIEKLGIRDVIIRDRDIDFFPATAHIKPIKAAKQIKARKIIAIETSQISKAGDIIDWVFNAGGTSIQDVTSFVLDGHNERLKAVGLASRKAQQKAQHVAKSLGVKLGRLLETSIVEDPSAPVLLRQRELGKNQLAYGDKDVHVVVAQRYEILNP
jgi:uncharacterized protein YggE